MSGTPLTDHAFTGDQADGQMRALTARAGRRVRRMSSALLVVALVSAVASVGLAASHADGEIRTIGPRVLAALALFAAGGCAVFLSWERSRRDLPRRAMGLSIMAVGIGLIYGGQGVLYLLTAGHPAPFEDWVEALPLITGAPVFAMGLILVAWPPRMTARDVMLVALDTVVGGLCLLVLWLLVIVPIEGTTTGRYGEFAAAVDPWGQFLSVLVVLIIAAASRRSGALAIRQLITVQIAVLVYVASDIVGDAIPVDGTAPAVSPSVVGYALAALIYRGFALAPAVEGEDLASYRLRTTWSVVIPFLPVPLTAIAILVHRLTVGPISNSLLVVTLIALIALVAANVLLRLFNARDLGRLQAARISAPLTGGAPAEWFEALLGDSRDVITVVDRDGSIVYQTPSASALLGLPFGAMTGKHAADLFPEIPRRQFMELLVRASHDDEDRGPYEFVVVDSLGRQHDTETVITPLSTEGLDGYVLTTNDISDRRRLSAALVDSSTRDALTGLPNREGFLSRVREDVPDATSQTIAVAFLDLHSFRDLNDSRGHDAGDAALKVVAAALERMPPTVTAVGRTGADEFGLLVAADPVSQELGVVERLLREALRGVLVDTGHPVDVDFAMGYAVKSERTDSAGDLVERADLALASSRTARSASAVAYRTEMRSALVQRLRSEADLRDALDADRLLVYYQPIVTLPDHRLHSVEALARLMTPSGEIVGPAGFIARAEELGLIGRLGRQVLSTALRDSNRISAAVGRPVPVSVNFSASQVDAELPEVISDALRAAGVPAERLVLELTESVLAEGHDTFGAVLDRVRAMGCRIALDDFGTGYSSLSYLAGLPVDLMKIDKSFVGRLGVSTDAFALVRTLLQLAQNLGLDTVAEGVETVEQADILRGMNCSRAQGYLFARPMPLADLEAALDIGGGVLPLSATRAPDA